MSRFSLALYRHERSDALRFSHLRYSVLRDHIGNYWLTAFDMLPYLFWSLLIGRVAASSILSPCLWKQLDEFPICYLC